MKDEDKGFKPKKANRKTMDHETWTDSAKGDYCVQTGLPIKRQSP